MASETPLSQSETMLVVSDQEGGLHLGRFLSAIKRNVLIVVGVTTLTAAAAVLKAVTDDPTYKSGFELLTPPTTLETQIISTINEDALSSQPDVFSVAIDETQLKILKSPRLMDPILQQVQERYPNVGYGELVARLSIKPDKTGNTLFVEYVSGDPVEVQYVLDVVSEVYLKYSLEDRQNAIFRGIDFVDEQLPVARQRVEDLESELEELRQNANLIDPLTQGEQLSQQAAQFNAEQLDLRVQIKQAESVYSNLQEELSKNEEFASTSILQESDRYQSLLDQLLELDSEIANQLTLYLEDSPEIEVIEERKDNLQPLLRREGFRVQQELASYIIELRDQDQALSETIDALNQQINDLSTVARNYGSIQRELEIATTNLNEFLTKREALRIDAAQRQTPWEILTPPSQPKASVASAKRNLLLGTILGLLLGAGAAILVDRIRGKIYTIDELKEVIGSRIPLLGVIPYEKLLEGGNILSSSLNQLSQLGFETDLFPDLSAASSNQDSISTPFFEAFRVLSTNLELNSPDKKINSFTISSAIPNMGKSTITFHLAHSIASSGRKVLMIDGDLRRPSLHHLCSVANEKGITNYVTGEFDLDDVITNLPIDENLFLLAAGPVPPDPIKILTAQRMKELVLKVKEKFDMVIFDSPPILGFADALILSTNTQGVLMPVSLGEIKFSQLQMALDELSIAKVPIFGVVANQVMETNKVHYSYYQYYHESSRRIRLSQSSTALETQDLASNNSWVPDSLKSLVKTLKNKD